MLPAQPGSRRGHFESSDSLPTTSAAGSMPCCRPSVASWPLLSASALRAGQDLFVGGQLGGIVQWSKVRDAAPLERAPYEVVGEMRVLREQGPMEIRPEDASLQATFRVVLAVVPEADAHAPKGPGRPTKAGAP